MGTPPTIQIASLGMWDSLILMVMALVVFGPRRLPEIGRQIGKLMYEFRKASNDFKFQMEEELRSAEEAERRKKDEERMRALSTTATPSTIEASTAQPAPDATAAGSSSYPPMITSTSETETGAATESPTEAASEESYPRIMPPSTGEQVPAARPNSPSVVAEGSSESEGKSENGAESALPANPKEPVSDAEKAAHHG
jgi:sec-independent protein translocase protein TatB